MKVFCKDCYYLLEYEVREELFGRSTYKFNCKHESNKEVKDVVTWYKAERMDSFKKPPCEINKNNDCKNFRGKGVKKI